MLACGRAAGNEPSSPRVLLNAILLASARLCWRFLGVLLAEACDRRVRTAEDARPAVLGVPFLAPCCQAPTPPSHRA
jgi:hypothetical protein